MLYSFCIIFSFFVNVFVNRIVFSFHFFVVFCMYFRFVFVSVFVFSFSKFVFVSVFLHMPFFHSSGQLKHCILGFAKITIQDSSLKCDITENPADTTHSTFKTLFFNHKKAR